jgi:hypothetical protein
MSTVDAAAETTNTKPVASSTSKKSRKKKKHVSKHVLQAKADAEIAAAAALTARSEESAAAAPSQSKKKRKEVFKDPEEASNYLKSWQAQEGWKFNKNTQSWLLRHMYETEKVSKSTFSVLLDYIKGLQGKDAKRRILEEATTRAKRYRDYEKTQKTNASTTPTETNANVVATTQNVSNEGSNDEPVTVNDSKPTEETKKGAVSNDTYGLQHWLTLDDHDKRKEYKRSRRLLEVLTDDMTE